MISNYSHKNSINESIFNDEVENCNSDCNNNKYSASPDLSVRNLQINHCKRYFSYTNIINIFLIFLLILIGIIGAYYAWSYYKINHVLVPLKVKLFCGEIEGFEKDGVVHYLGIPYALAPLGVHRFQPPVELNNKTLCNKVWNNSIYKAHQYKSICMQLEPRTNKLIGSEDCLYLNIYIPKKKSKTHHLVPTPVVVIFDGLLFLYQFESKEPNIQTVKYTELIHVTFNYRLGPLGFLINPMTNQTNLGIYDQLMVLRWIRINIALFGGNPVNVILFGYGSGATSALILLYSPIGHHLFDKLWISGPGLDYPSTNFKQALNKSKHQFPCRKSVRKLSDDYINEEVKKKEDEFLCYQSYFSNNSYLIKLWNWSVIVQWFERDLINFPQQNSFPNQLPQFLINDNKLISLHYWHNPIYYKPMIIGQTSHELSIFPQPKTIHFWHKSDLIDHVQSQLPKLDQELIENVYFKNQLENNQCLTIPDYVHIGYEYDLMKMLTDCRFTCPIINLTNHLVSKQFTTIYQYYLMNAHRLFDPYDFGAYASHTFHGWDGMIYLRSYFNHSDFNYPNFMYYDKDLKELNQTSDLFNQAMLEFAYNSHVSTWSKVKFNKHIVNVINRGKLCTQSQHSIFKERCEFWKLLLGDCSSVKGSWNY